MRFYFVGALILALIFLGACVDSSNTEVQKTQASDSSFKTTQRESLTQNIIPSGTGQEKATLQTETPQCAPNWQCGSWFECSEAGTQLRSCTDTANCGTSSNRPVEIQSCTPPCTPNWQCGSWTECKSNIQTRSCLDKNKCGTRDNEPPILQSCVSVPVCTPNWQCEAWGDCKIGKQSRGCTDTNKCNTYVGTPELSQSCVSICTPTWQCSGWSGCSFGKQTRTCIDQRSCGVTTSKPAESQSCTIQIPEPSPITLSGTGQAATANFNLEQGISIFEMKHTGARNFAIVLYGANGGYVDLLVNTIGQFYGSKLSSIDTKGAYLLDVTADGPWEVVIKQPRPTTGRSVPLTLSGTGQKASEIFYLNSGMARFKMKHTGTGNFAIVLYDANGGYTNLLVNTIGNFEGSKAAPISEAGLYLLDIHAGGNWEILIE